jgi:hypothetical protein
MTKHNFRINPQHIPSSIQVPISLSSTLTKSLPAEGWIKPCLLCKAPTSKVYVVFESGKLYKCHFCKDCFKHNNSIIEPKYSYAIRKGINVCEYFGKKYTKPLRK